MGQLELSLKHCHRELKQHPRTALRRCRKLARGAPPPPDLAQGHRDLVQHRRHRPKLALPPRNLCDLAPGWCSLVQDRRRVTRACPTSPKATVASSKAAAARPALARGHCPATARPRSPCCSSSSTLLLFLLGIVFRSPFGAMFEAAIFCFDLTL
jgi:hypothetical protein